VALKWVIHKVIHSFCGEILSGLLLFLRTPVGAVKAVIDF